MHLVSTSGLQECLFTFRRKSEEARGMRVWGSRRVGGHARTPGLHLCTHKTLDFGRKSRDLTGIFPKMGCTQQHVATSFTGMAARPPSYDRGNVFFMTIPTQKAGQMYRLWGDNHAHGAAESRPWSLSGRFRFQGSQRRFLALGRKRAFGATRI